MMNSVIILLLLAVVMVPFLGLLYSVADAWLNAPPPAEVTEKSH